jgi:FimV-like protein
MRMAFFTLLFLFVTSYAMQLGVTLPASYGPTSDNVGLWAIAAKYSPRGGQTLGQTMIAILDSNPTAFKQQNINGLKSGYMLTIPEETIIYKITREQAIRLIDQQNKSWGQVPSPPRFSTPHQVKGLYVFKLSMPQLYFSLLLLALIVVVTVWARASKAKKKKGDDSPCESIKVDDFAGDNRLESQLDLCKGYMQQGKLKDALLLANQVLREGNAAQQAEAKVFVNDIAELM